MTKSPPQLDTKAADSIWGEYGPDFKSSFLCTTCKEEQQNDMCTEGPDAESLGVTEGALLVCACCRQCFCHICTKTNDDEACQLLPYEDSDEQLPCLDLVHVHTLALLIPMSSCVMVCVYFRPAISGTVLSLRIHR